MMGDRWGIERIGSSALHDGSIDHGVGDDAQGARRDINFRSFWMDGVNGFVSGIVSRFGQFPKGSVTGQN